MKHSEPRWNLFAAKLEDLLDATLDEHGNPFGLGHLDDRAGINRETVRRLRKSIETSGHFYVLNPEQIIQVCEAFGWGWRQKLTLIAAVLVTGMEMKLADRIDAEPALTAAQQLFPIVEEAMRAEYLEDDGAIRVRKEGLVMDTSFDARYGAALNALDRGILALSLGERAHSGYEQQEQLREAVIWFSEAVERLEAAPEADRDEELQYWYGEAQRGKAQAKQKAS